MNSSEPFLLNPGRVEALKDGSFRSEHLRNARIGFWVFLTFTLGFAWLVRHVYGDGLDWLRLESSGVEGQARVVALRCDDDPEHTSWFVRYEIEQDGRPLPHTGREEEIYRPNYRVLQVGGAVPVVYLLDAPAVSRVGGDNLWKKHLAAGMIIGMIVLLFLLALVVVNARQIRLWQDGVFLEGRLLTCIGEEDSDHDFCIRTTYGFVSPGGHILSGKLTVRRDDLKGAELPGPETKVAVLYLNEKRFEVL